MVQLSPNAQSTMSANSTAQGVLQVMALILGSAGCALGGMPVLEQTWKDTGVAADAVHVREKVPLGLGADYVEYCIRVLLGVCTYVYRYAYAHVHAYDRCI